MPTSIAVGRVANGWFVQMPMPVPEQPSHGADMMKELKPVLREILDMQHRDPLLDSLRGEAEEEQTVAPVPTDTIGRDPQLYVFSDFARVLTFLGQQFL